MGNTRDVQWDFPTQDQFGAQLIGTQLRIWRNLRQYTVSFVAQRAGVSRKTVHHIESGQANPRLSTVLRLAEVLGVSGQLVNSLDPSKSELGRSLLIERANRG